MNPANLHSIQIERAHIRCIRISIALLITLHSMQKSNCQLHKNNVKMVLLCLTLLIAGLYILLVLLFPLAVIR